MTVKSLLKITGFILGLVISSVIILAFLVDANMFKPRIQAIAKQHGIELKMRGDLHWAYWPAIGLAVHDISVADIDSPQIVMAEVKKASFLVAFIPLMQGDFQVKHVLIDGADITVELNAQGQSNWQHLIKTGAVEAAPASTSTTAPKTIPKASANISSDDLKMSIEKLSLHHSHITYSDTYKNRYFSLNKIDLDMEDVNTTGNPFTMDFSWEMHIGKVGGDVKPMVISGDLHNTIALNEHANSLAIKEGKIVLKTSAMASGIAMNYALSVEDIKRNPHYDGNFSIATFDAKKILALLGVMPVLASPHALDNVAVNTVFEGDKNSILFKQGRMQIDSSSLELIELSAVFPTHQYKAVISGNHINLDDYMPVAENETTVTEIAEKESTEKETIKKEIAEKEITKKEFVEKSNANVSAVPAVKKLPLLLLQNISLDARIDFQQATFNAISLQQLVLDLDANNSELHEQLVGKIYAGSLQQQAKIAVNAQTAEASFKVLVQGLDVAPLLKDLQFDGAVNLNGLLQVDASGHTQGDSLAQLANNLQADISLSGSQFALSPINIEQQFCKLTALINHTDEISQSWRAVTPLRDLSGRASLDKKSINITTMTAAVEKLALNVKGTLNISTGKYDLVLPLTLNRDANDSPTRIATSAQGCTLSSNYWLERSMGLLHCTGSYAHLNPLQDCRADKEGLAALTKDYANYKLHEKYGDNIDAKKSEATEKLKKQLDEKLGEGGAEKAKNLLNTLFKKNNDH